MPGVRHLELRVGFRMALKAAVHIDASAALAITQRQGLGKFRHIVAHWFWMQDEVESGEVAAKKVDGTSNPAEFLTKHLSIDDIKEHLDKLHFEVVEGRVGESLAVTSVEPIRLRDCWINGGQCVIGVHQVPRRSFCSSVHYRRAPKLAAFTSTRVTHGVFSGGATFMKHDNWTCKSTRSVDMGQWWVGRIVFLPKISEIKHKASNLERYVGRICSFSRVSCDQFGYNQSCQNNWRPGGIVLDAPTVVPNGSRDVLSDTAPQGCPSVHDTIQALQGPCVRASVVASPLPGRSPLLPRDHAAYHILNPAHDSDHHSRPLASPFGCIGLIISAHDSFDLASHSLVPCGSGSVTRGSRYQCIDASIAASKGSCCTCRWIAAQEFPGVGASKCVGAQEGRELPQGREKTAMTGTRDSFRSYAIRKANALMSRALLDVLAGVRLMFLTLLFRTVRGGARKFDAKRSQSIEKVIGVMHCSLLAYDDATIQRHSQRGYGNPGNERTRHARFDVHGCSDALLIESECHHERHDKSCIANFENIGARQAESNLNSVHAILGYTCPTNGMSRGASEWPCGSSILDVSVPFGLGQHYERPNGARACGWSTLASLVPHGPVCPMKGPGSTTITYFKLVNDHRGTSSIEQRHESCILDDGQASPHCTLLLSVGRVSTTGSVPICLTILDTSHLCFDEAGSSVRNACCSSSGRAYNIVQLSVTSNFAGVYPIPWRQCMDSISRTDCQ